MIKKSIHKQIIADSNWQLVQISGKNMSGLDFFCLLATNDTNLKKIDEESKKPGFNAADFGFVIELGFGAEAPPLLLLEAIDKFKSGNWLLRNK